MSAPAVPRLANVRAWPALALSGRSWLPPVLVASAVAALYLIVDPRTSDLPTHVFRAELFARDGFTLWSNQWYGGHHTPAYSVLFPPLAWLVGPMVVGAVSAVASAALFERLVSAHFGERARLGALWFGVATGSQLFTDRLTFSMGVAIGLGALLAAQRERPEIAGGLAVLSALASPVAGAFAALAGLARLLTGARLDGAALILGGVVPPLLLALAFPEGGRHPFVFSSYVGVPLVAAAFLALLPARERTLRIGAALYALAGTVAFAIDTPMGGNAARLGALFGGPVLAAALLGRPRPRALSAILAVTLVALAYWQWAPAVRAYADARADPATQEAYYTPLLDFLRREPPAGRVEIPFTRSHFEAAEVGIEAPLARGWQRQLDVERNELFYEGELTHDTYSRWLRDNAVSYVAVPDAALDYSAVAERRLVDQAPPYLRPRWTGAHWRVFEVVGAPALAEAERGAALADAAFTRTGFRLDFERPGAALVRVRFSPYWRAEGACVEPAGPWTRVVRDRPGPVSVGIDFSVDRIVERGRRCG